MQGSRVGLQSCFEKDLEEIIVHAGYKLLSSSNRGYMGCWHDANCQPVIICLMVHAAGNVKPQCSLDDLEKRLIKKLQSICLGNCQICINDAWLFDYLSGLRERGWSDRHQKPTFWYQLQLWWMKCLDRRKVVSERRSSIIERYVSMMAN